jgi:hypothetical protein
MKKLLILISCALLLASTSFAVPVLFDSATLSGVVYENVGGVIHPAVINNNTYISIVALGSSLPKTDFAVVIEEATGALEVIEKSDGAIKATIISFGTATGFVANNPLTDYDITSDISLALVAGPTTAGTAFSILKYNTAVSPAVRTEDDFSFITGATSPEVVVKGSVKTTGHKYSY